MCKQNCIKNPRNLVQILDSSVIEKDDAIILRQVKGGASRNLKGGFGIWLSPRQQSSQKVTISSALRNTSLKK